MVFSVNKRSYLASILGKERIEPVGVEEVARIRVVRRGIQDPAIVLYEIEAGPNHGAGHIVSRD
jgi:hypothetical protein